MKPVENPNVRSAYIGILGNQPANASFSKLYHTINSTGGGNHEVVVAMPYLSAGCNKQLCP